MREHKSGLLAGLGVLPGAISGPVTLESASGAEMTTGGLGAGLSESFPALFALWPAALRAARTITRRHPEKHSQLVLPHPTAKGVVLYLGQV